jgi:hypothetical protein
MQKTLESKEITLHYEPKGQGFESLQARQENPGFLKKSRVFLLLTCGAV